MLILSPRAELVRPKRRAIGPSMTGLLSTSIRVGMSELVVLRASSANMVLLRAAAPLALPLLSSLIGSLIRSWKPPSYTGRNRR